VGNLVFSESGVPWGIALELRSSRPAFPGLENRPPGKGKAVPSTGPALASRSRGNLSRTGSQWALS